MVDLSPRGEAGNGAPPLSPSADGYTNAPRTAGWFRQRAERARQLLRFVHQPDLTDVLAQLVAEFEETAEDLELGAAAPRHPALLR